MDQMVTLDLLHKILETHTRAIVRKFSSVLQQNNEQMGEYVQESIEAISALQIKHNDIQSAVRDSLEDLSGAIVKEVAKTLSNG